eukprot:10521938-Ditylum_brightwellii.AAC.1
MLTGVYQHSPDDPDFPHPIQDSNTETHDDSGTNTNIPSTDNDDSPDEEPSLVNNNIDIHDNNQHNTESSPIPEQHPKFETNPNTAEDPDIDSDGDKMPNLQPQGDNDDSSDEEDSDDEDDDPPSTG